MNKTTKALKLAEEYIAGMKWSEEADEALAAIREALAESKPAPDGRIPKTVFTLDDISKAAEMGRQAGMIDALVEPVKQEPVAAKLDDLYKEKTSGNVDEWQYIEGWNDALDIAEQHFNTWLQAEPVAVVGTFFIEQILGTHLHEGQKLYAAPVSAKREWVDLEPWQLCEIEERIGLPIDSHDFETIGNAYIAAFKEKNK